MCLKYVHFHSFLIYRKQIRVNKIQQSRRIRAKMKSLKSIAMGTAFTMRVYQNDKDSFGFFAMIILISIL